MKVWTSPGSPPCKTIHYILKKFGIEYEQGMKGMFDTKTPEYKKNVNSKGQIPVAEIEGGYKLTQSRAIIAYLLSVHDKDNTLLPRDDTVHMAKVDELFDIHSTWVYTKCQPALNEIMIGPSMMGADPPTEERKKELMSELHGVLQILEDTFGDGQYFTGDTLTIADIHMYNLLLGYVLWLGVDLSAYDKLNTWYKTVSEDPLVAECDDEANKFFAEMQAAMMKKS